MNQSNQRRRLDGKPHGHNHLGDMLMIGCPACIAETRALEEVVRWVEAPVRKVTWTCSYTAPNDDLAGPPRTATFTLEVPCPSDATGDELDVFYADLTGEAFVLALPDDIPMNHTTACCESMDVDNVTIGPPVNPPTPTTIPQPPLFDLGDAS